MSNFDWVGKAVICVGLAHPCPCLEPAQISFNVSLRQNQSSYVTWTSYSLLLEKKLMSWKHGAAEEMSAVCERDSRRSEHRRIRCIHSFIYTPPFSVGPSEVQDRHWVMMLKIQRCITDINYTLTIYSHRKQRFTFK